MIEKNDSQVTLSAMKVDFPVTVVKNYSVKSSNGEDNWYIEGYASTTDYDLQGDIITDDCLKQSESDLLRNSTVLYNHNSEQPIGRVVEAKLTKEGLWIKVLISKTEPSIWQKIKEGVLNKFSIGARVLEAHKEFVDSLGKVANIIKQMLLVEVSLVAVPANPNARALGWYVGKALKDFEEKGGVLEMIDTMKGAATEDAFAGTPEENNRDVGEDMITDESAVQENGKVAEEIQVGNGTASVQDLKDAIVEEDSEKEKVIEEKPEKVEEVREDEEVDETDNEEDTADEGTQDTVTTDTEHSDNALKEALQADANTVEPAKEEETAEISKAFTLEGAEKILREAMNSASLDDIKSNITRALECIRNSPKDKKGKKPAESNMGKNKEESANKPEEKKKELGNNLTRKEISTQMEKEVEKRIDSSIQKRMKELSGNSARKGLVTNDKGKSEVTKQVEEANKIADPEDRLKSLLALSRN